MHGEGTAIRWQCGSAEMIGLTGVYAALRLRAEVFVVEQQCAYADVDGRDLAEGVLHLLAWRDADLLACARLLPPGMTFAAASIGRVVVAPSARGQGLAHALMQRAIDACSTVWPESDILLSAQAHLQDFYAAHGFVACSERYLEDGIPHVDMRRIRPAKPPCA